MIQKSGKVITGFRIDEPRVEFFGAEASTPSCANRKLTIPSRIGRRNYPKVSNLGPAKISMTSVSSGKRPSCSVLPETSPATIDLLSFPMRKKFCSTRDMVSLWAAAPHSCGTLSLGIGAMQLLLDPGEEREARDDPAPLDIESWGVPSYMRTA